MLPWICGCRTRGAAVLADFEASRKPALQELLQAEVARVAAEVEEDSFDFRLHQQCVTDFHRGEYTVGAQSFVYGRPDAGGNDSCGVELARQMFLDGLIQECAQDPQVVYVASAVMTQIAMAHIGSSFFSGHHAYWFPSGYTSSQYVVRKRGANLQINLERITQGFPSFSLPGGEPYDCDEDSYVRQHATVTLTRGLDGKMQIAVEDAWEAVRIFWPDGDPVVHNGLELVFSSPAHRREALQCIGGVGPGLVRCAQTFFRGLSWRMISRLALCSAPYRTMPQIG